MNKCIDLDGDMVATTCHELTIGGAEGSNWHAHARMDSYHVTHPARPSARASLIHCGQ